MTRDDLKKLFPNSKFPTAEELKAKEDTFSIGDRVKVSDNIRCRQHGQTGTIVRIEPEDEHGWKSFVVEFDDEKYNSMGFHSNYIDKFVEKKASSKPMTPEELKKLYLKLKYRILHKETNRPFFNTNRKAFANWHLLSPDQIKKHKIGICWDTAAMTDAELSAAGVPHENYFSHAKDLNRPTHAFNVYNDENGEWRWIEGSWEKYKDNDWHERRKRDLVRRIVKALESEGFDEETGGDKQILHKIDRFPDAGVNGHQFFDAMLSAPVKKASEKKASGTFKTGIGRCIIDAIRRQK